MTNCPSIKYKISPNQIYICHLSSIIFSASYVRTILLLRVEDALDSSNFHFHLREEKEKLSSTRRDLLTDSITDSLKLRGIFIVGHECKLPVGSGILAVLIIFKRVGGNLNWKFLLPPPPLRPPWSFQPRIITDHRMQNGVPLITIWNFLIFQVDSS